MTNNQNHSGQSFSVLFLIIALISCSFFNSFADTVTGLSGTYRNGQVFLTWANPSGSNLQYNLYRSTTQITASSQLTANNFLGFVRDSSSKNIRISMLSHSKVYFQIVDGGTPLSPNTGVYVVTCVNSKSYYYAVTVTDLSTDKESKTLTLGSNSLASSIKNQVSTPLPVFQYSETWNDGETIDRYVQFVDNQETASYPAMNSTGSYGFNFYVLKRGSATRYPILALYEGLEANSIEGNGFGELENETISNCYILGFDDWLPITKQGSSHVGDNTYFCCYYENFNIYTDSNPVPDTGVVKMYPQHRYIAAIRWAKQNLPVDTSRVYTLGNSAGGYGAALTAEIIPNEIAAVYSVVEPLSPNASGHELYDEMWGAQGTNLNSDLVNWQTGAPIPIKQAKDLSDMVHLNRELASAPLIFDVHGKQDVTVTWSGKKVAWLDSLQSNEMGGVFYWDQRQHGGFGANFSDTETTPDFSRYYTTKSYPAFSNCSINQDPGNGDKNNGDPYGAINGYLDWNDNVTDESCDYSVNVFVKDLYVDGELDSVQYKKCTTDITFRRLQNFHPEIGNTIKWKNLDNTNTKIQSGSIVYDGGLITLQGVKVNKTGNTISLSINNCKGIPQKENLPQENSEVLQAAKASSGYTVTVNTDKETDASVQLVDILGRLVSQKKIHLFGGSNTFGIQELYSGTYLLQVSGDLFSAETKLIF